MDVENGDVDLLPGERLFDHIFLLCGDTQAMKSSLNELATSVRRYGMCFAPPKCSREVRISS